MVSNMLSGLFSLSSSFTWLIGIPSHPTVGDIPLGVREPDLGLRLSTVIFSPLGLAPGRWFFCLNFSSHTGSLIWLLHSALPRVAANFLASSRIRSSSMGRHSPRRFFAQLVKVRSMSGNLLFDFLTGDLRPSSATRYFSFWRRTFETVLYKEI